MWKLFKKYLALLFVTVALILYYDHHNRSKFYYQLIKTYTRLHSEDVNSRQCRIPNYDPWDPSIADYIDSNVSAIDCTHGQPPLTYMDMLGYLHVNRTALRQAGYTVKQIWCYFREIIREEDDDDEVDYGRIQIMRWSRVKVEHEFILVRCFHKHKNKSNTMIYETGHARLKSLPRNLELRSRYVHKHGAVNVVIMMLDSMSRLNVIRQLPKTLQWLEKRMNATVFRGMTKVGENTLPNLMVMLTGLAAADYEDDSSPAGIGPFYYVNKSAFFDDIPAVWKDFSKQDYVTFFAEDMPEYAAFNYLTYGFMEPPTDYYMRPLWLVMDKLNKTKSNDTRCYGHIPKHELLWNYMEKFIHKMSAGHHAHFVFTANTELAHDDVNNIQVVDEYLLRMLRRLMESGSLDHTMFIMMGDHGNRLDTIRETVIGSIEDRMPFFAISLPEKLQHFRANLVENSRVLTSWHDVYETLMDVVTDNLKPQSRVVRHGFHGSSLLRTVRKDRSCHEVGVPTEYCVCNVERDMDTKSEHALVAALAIVNHVNELLLEEDLSSKCDELKLDHVLHAQLNIQHGAMEYEDEREVLIRVAVRTKPSNASFEGILNVNLENGIEVVGTVNRINKYGNQSYCIEEKHMKKYCHCKA